MRSYIYSSVSHVLIIGILLCDTLDAISQV